MNISEERLKVFAKDYLENYLEYNKAKSYPNGLMISNSEKRKDVLNKYFRYPMIITRYHKGLLVSASDEGIKKYCFWNHIDLTDDFNELYMKLKALYPDTNIRKMERKILSDSAIKKYIDNSENQLYNSINRLIKIVNKKNSVQAFYHGNSIGYCSISDITNGYANIVVSVEEKFQHKYLATILLSTLLNTMDLQTLRPVYWVDTQNTASIKLADHCGFLTVAKEIVFGGVISKY